LDANNLTPMKKTDFVDYSASNVIDFSTYASIHSDLTLQQQFIG